MGASGVFNWIGGVLVTAYGEISLGALAFTVVVFLLSARKRSIVYDAMADSRKPLRFFDLSRGDAGRAQRERRPVAPEKLWTYDETYLTQFARRALESGVGPERTALHVYVRTILRRLDILFAVGLGIFTTTIDLAIAQALGPEYPIGMRAAWIGAYMGFLYLVADVSEDLKLGAILGRTLEAKGRQVIDVDPAEAAAVNLLTRVKVVTLTCSGTGLLVYAGLAVVETIAFGPPHSAVPVDEQRPNPAAR